VQGLDYDSVKVDGAAAEIISFLVKRPMPLVRTAPDKASVRLLESHPLEHLFLEALSPQGAMAGLWLAAGNWNRAHQISQDLESREGHYWHAIVHRMEPDPGNAKYWLHRVGAHPIHPGLAAAAKAVDSAYDNVLSLDEDHWDAGRFVDLCTAAPGTALEPPVREVQHAEWLLLLSHCARSSVH